MFSDLALRALTVRLGQGSPAVGTSSSNPDMTSATGGNSLQSSTSAPGDSGSGTGAEWPALGGGSGIGSSKNSGTGATQLSSVVVDPGN